MKKLFVLLIVLAALFSFSTGAFAQTAPVAVALQYDNRHASQRSVGTGRVYVL